MSEMAFHNGKPIQKQPSKRDTMLSGRSMGDMAETRLRQSQDHVRLEITNSIFQLPAADPRPKKILKIQNPFPKGWAEARFFDFLEEKGQFDLGMDKQAIRKIRIAGNMELKGCPLDQVPVHNNPHPAVIMRRHNAHEH
jgi:hypothetical protein